ncbi:uncharacterized protein PAC_06506 [Phialocephala subalpina]|uniref:Uncharacterized protein n=1 Tax=Phialocephala subalpina TaxID=576137 RepID=A0A1L7WV15_9HELO|nr:uncharacterized protein PAC_06506 [Phialocephala subalpina]
MLYTRTVSNQKLPFVQNAFFNYPRAILAPFTALAANGQVNFYWDADCQNYAGHQNLTPASSPGAGHVVGGLADAQSILWVYVTPDSNCSMSFQFPHVLSIVQSSIFALRRSGVQKGKKHKADDAIDGAYPLFCKNSECNAYDVASIGECKHFKNGVWAEYCGE